jgi:hypothetical protein
MYEKVLVALDYSAVTERLLGAAKALIEAGLTATLPARSSKTPSCTMWA